MATVIATLETQPMLSPAEVGTIFRCDPKTVTRWAKAGRIHWIKTPGGHRRYFRREVEAMLRGETWEPPGGWPEVAA